MSTMSQPAPVVVAVADEHDAALRYAAAEAVREGRTLRLVHVIAPPRGIAGPEAMLLTFEAVELVGQDLLSAQVERAEKLVDGRVPVERALGRGSVVGTLVDQCAGAHQIVLQQRHGPRLGRILTGSTIAGLAARAPVPVVSVPEHWDGPRPTPLVTVALGEADDGARGDVLLGRGFAEAESRGACLTVLHAWYLPAEYGQPTVGLPTLELWRDRARQQLEARLASWRETHPSVDVRVEVPHLRPVDAIVRASRHSDVALVARRRSHGLVHLGSVVRTAVREALCPLVVVTPDTQSPVDRTAARSEAVSAP